LLEPDAWKRARPVSERGGRSARFIGHRLRVKLFGPMVTVFDRGRVVAEHHRAAGNSVKVLNLDHYLEILARKPGARWSMPAPPGRSPRTHDAFLGGGPPRPRRCRRHPALIEVLL
jgi:hypothetical protein